MFRFTAGVWWGAFGGLGAFLADLVSAAAAIGFLWVPNRDSFLLLLAPMLAMTVVGALFGGLLALVPLPRFPRGLLVVGIGLLFVCGTVAGTLSRGGRGDAAAGPPPSSAVSTTTPVLWIVIDTLRADKTYGADLGFPHAGALRGFARRAITFTEAESTAGWTIPSMVALLTGVHHTTAGASTSHLPMWATTAAEFFLRAGYETRAIIDNPVLDPRNGFAQGFQSFEQRSSYRFVFSMAAFRALPNDVREWLRFNLRTPYLGAPGLTDAAIGAINAAGDRPLFLLVHYMDPHAPYYAHDVPDPADSEPVAFWRARDRLREDPTDRPPSPAQMRLLRHRYDQEIAHTDAALGRLLAAWEERYGRTGFIAITADHGEEFLEHGRLSHSNNVHRESVHVPLIVQLPDQRHDGAIVRTPVNHLGLLPTALDVVGLSQSGSEGPTIQGQSWLPLLDIDASPPTCLVANHGRHGHDTKRVRQGHWVYIRSDYYDDRPSEEALFDLRSDPREQHDVSAQHPETKQKLQRTLGARMTSFATAFDLRAPREETDDEALRALGYVQ
jgi:arylsulfatase A-like enzyme